MENISNIEIIKKIYSAFKAKDLQTILQLQTEDTEWSVAGPADKIPWAAARHGHSGVEEFLKVLGSLLIPEVFIIADYFESKEKVVTLGFQKGYVHTSKIPYEFDFVHVWNLKDGKVSRFRVYYDSDYVAGILNL
jgi:ketosteroid isomerase-like protein